jgi:hypothetical protein
MKDFDWGKRVQLGKRANLCAVRFIVHGDRSADPPFHDALREAQWPARMITDWKNSNRMGQKQKIGPGVP